MDTRRSFIRKASILSGGAGLLNVLPVSIAKALAIDPAPGSSYLDAEYIVFLMQENRSFDHTYGTLQGVRGFNDPRAIKLPNNNSVWLQSNKAGDTFAPFRFDIKDTKITWMGSIPHSWDDQVDARNNGRYDQWLDAKRSGHKEYADMPLTLGYYTRGDIPFYYSLADAFTVCDQNFCSSLTGTTPNRLYFWSGTIRERQDANAIANVWNSDVDYDSMGNWKTFPERLEENNISWKVYQNELTVGVGFNEAEDAWLSNFGDNPLEYFSQYQVKFSPEFIKNLPAAAETLRQGLKKAEATLPSLSAGSKEAKQIQKDIEWLKKQLIINSQDQENFTTAKFDQLSQLQKNIHQKAFDVNRKDPFYHQLTTLKYKDGNITREAKIPKGDILHQFRQDVKNKNLPTVSWLVAPEHFSDHPSSAWYGAWYISEVMDILTKDPEVWKKTIFILTYDENDGYFDHVPPFVPSHPTANNTGLVSKGIDPAIEYVANNNQQSRPEEARISPIGLGFRVPLVIASPWSRGGWVNSEVFDHTSSLMFLEKFLSHKTRKKITEPNISEWRRTICGDLTSVFRKYNGEKLNKLQFLQKKKFIESIHKAQFKNIPSNFRKLTQQEVEQFNKNTAHSPFMPVQEKGIRNSCALNYELYVNGNISADKKKFEIRFQAKKNLFGDRSLGAPFYVYAMNKYQSEILHVRNYTVSAGDELIDQWSIGDFENGNYHLCVYGPNGFFREFKGSANDPEAEIICAMNMEREMAPVVFADLVIAAGVTGKQTLNFDITDNAYHTGQKKLVLVPGSKVSKVQSRFETAQSFGWYDYSVTLKDNKLFEKRFAGRLETGRPGKTDPGMGRII